MAAGLGFTIALVTNVTFNVVFIMLFFFVYKKGLVDFIRMFIYAKKGYGIVYLIRRDKRIVEYFTKITGEKIRINLNTYITNPNMILIQSKVNVRLRKLKDNEKEKLEKLKEKLDKAKTNEEKQKIHHLIAELEHKILKEEKEIQEMQEIYKDNLVELGKANPERMQLVGNMPCYFFKEGNIEPMNLADLPKSSISSKHLDDIIVDAQTAPKINAAFNWFQENKKMLIMLFIFIVIVIFMFLSVTMSQGGGGLGGLAMVA